MAGKGGRQERWKKRRKEGDKSTGPDAAAALTAPFFDAKQGKGKERWEQPDTKDARCRKKTMGGEGA